VFSFPVDRLNEYCTVCKQSSGTTEVFNEENKEGMLDVAPPVHNIVREILADRVRATASVSVSMMRRLKHWRHRSKQENVDMDSYSKHNEKNQNGNGAHYI